MKPKQIIYFLLFFCILLAGCTQSAENSDKEFFHMSTYGTVSVDFVSKIPSSFPVLPFTSQPVYFAAEIKNTGESNTTGVVCIEGISNWESYDSSTGSSYSRLACRNFTLEPAILIEGKLYPDATRVYIPKEGVFYAPPSNIPGTTKQEITLKYCYVYETKIIYPICVYLTTDAYKKGYCKPRQANYTAGPLILEDFYQLPSFISNQTTQTEYVVALYGKIKNAEKDVIIFDPKKFWNNFNPSNPSCPDVDLYDLGKVRYDIRIGRLGNNGTKFIAKCSDLQIDPDTLEGEFYCVIRIPEGSLNSIGVNSSSEYYTDVLTLTLRYGVLVRKTTYIDLKPLLR